MRHSLRPLLMGAALAIAASLSHATIIPLHADLVGSNEVPPTGSPGTGTANVILDTALQTLHVEVSFSGLLSPTTASHIHCCLPTPFATGVNVGVATTVPTFPGFPLGATSGIYDHILDLTDSASYNPVFITAQGGTVAGAEAALIAGLLGGETYLNIHTNLFQGGEIRGFLVRLPEPEGLAFLALALAAAGIPVRRKRG